MNDLSPLLANTFLGNDLSTWLTSLGTFLAVLAAIYAVRYVVVRHLKAIAEKTETDLDDFLVDLLGKIRSPEYHLVALYVASRGLRLSGGFDKALHLVFVLVLSWRAVTLLQAAVSYGLGKAVGRDPKDPGSASAMQSLRLLLNIVVWIGAGVFVLDNLGINISTVVAGLGIGGVAVALAAQQILGDLFSSFVIFMDRPFRLGDFITSGTLSGTVEHVGIKTTRLRSLGGELLVVPNKDLTSSPLSNFQEMRRRRVVLQFRVAHATPHAKAAAVPGFAREVVAAVPRATFDRAHLCGLGETGLLFEAVYYVESPDYGAFMDAQQAVDLALLERLQKEGVQLAAVAGVAIRG
ncbi:MAG: mechanosensitive ion channel family protein [Elusimicrobiota bacterium]|jgi:small-conductance mechanosensitive channel